MSLATIHGSFKVSLLATLVLILTLIQGTSTSLNLVYKLSPTLEPTLSALWGLTYLVALLGLVTVADTSIDWYRILHYVVYRSIADDGTNSTLAR